MPSVSLVLLTNASFTIGREMKSQLGYLLQITDKNGRSNIDHHSSGRCRRVTSPDMASEVHDLVLGFDQASSNRHMLEEIPGRNIELHGYVDSKTVF